MLRIEPLQGCLEYYCDVKFVLLRKLGSNSEPRQLGVMH